MSWIKKASQMTIQDILEYIKKNGSGYFKYIRTGSDEFRFSDVDAMTSHKDLSQGEPVKSAAFVNIKSQGLYVDSYSMSLNKGPAADDELLLSRMFSLPVISRYD